MEFFNRQTFWDYSDRSAFKGWSPRRLASFAMSVTDHEYSRIQVQLELRWIEAYRPYYSIYSPIAKMLVNTKLDIDCKHVSLPLPELLIRFPANNPLPVGRLDRRLKSILVGSFSDVNCLSGDKGNGLGLWCDRGEIVEGLPAFDFQTILLKDGITVEESISKFVDFQLSDDQKALHDALRIVVGVCLLANDSSLVIPDVLAKDRHKDLSEAMIQRAHRRGKIGWIIGQGMEVSPHIRRPHFAIRWTGKGGEIPTLRPIKGSIVHKKVVEAVPTGFNAPNLAPTA